MLKYFILCLMLAMGLSSAAIAQACPDWSSRFDQIDDPVVIQTLRLQQQQGWPFNAGSTPQQQISNTQQLLSQLETHIAADEQGWRQTGVGARPVVNAMECKNPAALSAPVLALCDEHQTRNTLLALQGTLEIERCRLGMASAAYPSSTPASPYAGPSMSNEATGSLSESGSRANVNEGAASMADSNVLQRAGMVDSATQNWQPPTEEQAATTTLGESTSLTDPFANPGPQNDGSASVNSSPSPTSWSDPMDSNASQGGDGANSSTAESSFALLSDAEIAATLDTGASNSNEVSATPVAQVPNSSQWNQFSSSSESLPDNTSNTSSIDPGTGTWVPDAIDQQIDDDTEVLKETSSQLGRFLPNNELSDKMRDQGVEATNAETHWIHHTLIDAVDETQDLTAGRDTSSEKTDADLQDLGPTLAYSIPFVQPLNQAAAAIDSVTTTITKKVDTVECLFSFNPYCK